MKKLSIIALLLSVAVLMQYCKKSDSTDDTTTTTTSTVLYQAYINGAVWTPKTTSTVLTYNATAQTKTLVFTADSTADRIVLSLKLPSTKVDSGFKVQTYVADTTGAPVIKNDLQYFKKVNNVYTTVGNVKSGYVTISAIDSIKKTVTGTFALSQNKLNYDGGGKVVSITTTAITSGQFNSMPYTFKKQ